MLHNESVIGSRKEHWSPESKSSMWPTSTVFQRTFSLLILPSLMPCDKLLHFLDQVSEQIWESECCLYRSTKDFCTHHPNSCNSKLKKLKISSVWYNFHFHPSLQPDWGGPSVPSAGLLLVWVMEQSEMPSFCYYVGEERRFQWYVMKAMNLCPFCKWNDMN